jgi:hypothetical protein
MEPFDAQPTPPRRGRRDNGLGADRYVPLLDVDPRVGEHLLDVLRLAGVPAYLEPAMDIDSYTRATSIPSPPTDRLWVDTQRRDTARDIVTAETSAPIRPGRAGEPPTEPVVEPGAREEAPSHGLSDLDEELAWREIVSRYDRDYPTDPARGGVPPWPASEDMDMDVAAPVADPPKTDPPKTTEPPELPERRPSGAHRADRRTERGDRRADRSGDRRSRTPDQDDDPEDHFVPPAPPPVPRLSKQSILALFLIAAGALLLLWPDGLGFSEQSGLALGVVCLISAGGLLVLRLRDDRYDGPDDDGAVL